MSKEFLKSLLAMKDVDEPHERQPTIRKDAIPADKRAKAKILYAANGDNFKLMREISEEIGIAHSTLSKICEGILRGKK